MTVSNLTPSRLYQGTLLHQLVHRAELRNHLLNGDASTMKQYQDMLSVVLPVHPQEASTETQQPGRQPLNTLSSNMQLLLLQEEEEEMKEARVLEELQLDDQVSMKTRYRTKKKKNRCNPPELTRKEERRSGNLL